MTSEMVERVARAMHTQSIKTLKLSMAREGFIQIPLDMVYMFKEWESTEEISRESMREQARAAIEAMREPTSAVIEFVARDIAMDQDQMDDYWEYYEETAKSAIEALVDAAISEKGEGC